MKRVQALQAATAGLVDYTSQSGGGSDWNGFRNYDDGSVYKELRQALADIQHGLCGYCEINLVCHDQQIEHIIPRSDPNSGAAHTLDHGNMMACCNGGTATNLFGPDVLHPDRERFLATAKENSSCGQAKGDRSAPCFIDPRTLPDLPSLLFVRDDGKIQADEDACVAAGVSVTRLRQTVEILGLNVRRLRRAREDRWDSLHSAWADYFDDPDVIKQAARAELLPTDIGVLSKFFTTNRSYFGTLSETILAEHPQAWI